MLILVRKVGKKLKIGDDITVAVVGLEGDRVQIGIDAPADVAIEKKPPTGKMKDRKASKSNRTTQDKCY